MSERPATGVGHAAAEHPSPTRHAGKIFGVGMPKTGTSSLTHALEILGYRACHFPHDPVTVEEVRAARYELSILRHYDALTDVPVPAIFAQLDAAWPGSKFVLTVRERSSWLGSCRRAPFNQLGATPEPGSAREFYRALLYGCVAFDEGRFGWVYDRHLSAVREHFSGPKAAQLLVLDVVGGEGWDALCPFLGVPVPGVPFPHANSSTGTPLVREQGEGGARVLGGGRRLWRRAARLATHFLRGWPR